MTLSGRRAIRRLSCCQQAPSGFVPPTVGLADNVEFTGLCNSRPLHLISICSGNNCQGSGFSRGMRTRKAIRRARKGKSLTQVGVLAYRRARSGALELLLVTTRSTRRFMIPKGWRMKGKSEVRSACEEAREEAGVVGSPERSPIGTFQYWKRLRAAFVPITVKVFAMEVESELAEWRERGERSRAWLAPEQAAALVDEPALSAILLGASQHILRRRSPLRDEPVELTSVPRPPSSPNSRMPAAAVPLP